MPSCSEEQNHLCNFSGGIMGNIHVNLYEIRTNVQEEMSFQDIAYLLI